MSQNSWAYRDCTDKRCISGALCRQAACGQYTIICKGLTNTDWPDGTCKFYKTPEQYAKEQEEMNERR